MWMVNFEKLQFKTRLNYSFRKIIAEFTLAACGTEKNLFRALPSAQVLLTFEFQFPASEQFVVGLSERNGFLLEVK
jgi:hypothetical protein